MKKVFHPFLFLLFSIILFSCENEAPKAENTETPKAVNAQDSSQEEVAQVAEKTLLGEWFVVEMTRKGQTEKMEKGALLFKFDAAGQISILNQEDNSTADYEFIEEENLIKVTNSDGAPETWTINKWEAKSLIITASSPDGEEVLVTLKR